MIETRNLTKTFDNFTAVDSLDLKIETGEFFGLLGPNGAGKTTTISLLSTLLLPTKGEILIDGQTLKRNRPDLKRKISVITQEYSMRQDMTMDEIMEYQGRLYFMPRKEIKQRTEELLEFCDLIKFRRRTVRKLSGGMKRRVGIAQALLNDPEILILDEPTAGLDPGERVRFRNLLSEFAQERIVLISTHIVSDVEYIAAENAVMKAGKIIAQDTTEGLVKQIEAKVWQGNIPMEQLARWEHRLRVVNLRNEPDGTVTLRYLADAPQLPDSVPAQPRLEDLYLWLFPEEMEEAK